MAIDFSQVKTGDLLQVQPLDKTVKLFMERQGYIVGSTVQVIEVSEPIASFNPRTGTDEIYLHITITNGNRPLGFDVRESEGYVSEYFS
ncbi:MAG: hypothetical protein WD469_11390 [Paenibacillaceae bacterium]